MSVLPSSSYGHYISSVVLKRFYKYMELGLKKRLKRVYIWLFIHILLVLDFFLANRDEFNIITILHEVTTCST